MPSFFRKLRLTLAGFGLSLFVSTAPAQDMGLGKPEDQRNLIAGICTTQLKDLGAAGCTCLAERSLTELDDPQRIYLILSVVQPPAAERLPIAREKTQLAAIFTFLETAHTACGKPEASPADTGATSPQPPAAGQSTQQ